MNRPELERLLEDIRKGLVDVVVVIKVDRLTRDGYDGQWLLKYSQQYDVILDLMYEWFDVNTIENFISIMKLEKSYKSQQKKLKILTFS